MRSSPLAHLSRQLINKTAQQRLSHLAMAAWLSKTPSALLVHLEVAC